MGYLTRVHTQYKALLPKEITATVGVRIGLRSVNISLLGTYTLDTFVHMYVNVNVSGSRKFIYNIAHKSQSL